MGKLWGLLLAGTLAFSLAGVTGFTEVAGVQAAGASGASCLAVSAVGSSGSSMPSSPSDPLEVDVGESIQLKYVLTPSGSYTESTARDPINMVMLLDKSSSMNNTDGSNKQSRITIEKTASKDLVDQISGTQLNDKIGIVQFNDVASVLADRTNNYNALKAQINSLSPSGGTNIEHALRKAIPMLTGVNHPYIVLVTDGYTTHYYEDSRSGSIKNEQKARSMALTVANELAAMKVPVYTVALGAIGGSDVDHQLLASIASKTGAKDYKASNTTELNQVFANIKQEISKQGTIKTIAIRQPLPNGFVLADNSTPGAYMEQVNGINTLVIPTSDIQYPYTIANRTVTVNIKQDQPGLYNMVPSALHYKIPCSTDTMISPIPLNMTIHVLDKARATDMYGNTYQGDRHGNVTRFRLGNEEDPQWTVPGMWSNPEYRVSEITLSDDAHTRVHVDYTAKSGQKGASDWNLLPTAPTAFSVTNGSIVFDAHGNPITDTDWHQGPAKVTATGSKAQLPPSTIYKNTDFTTDYLTYQLQVTSKENTLLQDWTPITPATVITESGLDLKIEARAATAAITSNANDLLGGPSSSTTVALDVLPPELPTVTAEFTRELQTYQYTVDHIYDEHSRVETAKLLKEGSSINGKVMDRPTFTATETDIVAGKYAIEVKDHVRFETVKLVTELPEDTTRPVIDEGDNTWKEFEADNERSFTITVSDPESYVFETIIKIGNKQFKPQPKQTDEQTDDHTVIYEFKLSDIITKEEERAGWHQMIITSTNVKGLVQQAEQFVLVNPGPTGGWLTSDGDYSTMFSNVPVAVTAADISPIVVPEARFTRLNGEIFTGHAVIVKSMGYAILPMGPGRPAAIDFKPLGSLTFRVDKEGQNRIFLRLVDSLGVDNLMNKSVIPQVNVNIDYRQKRY
ncbi:vWA domain-containing protein [Paenibacillus agricola]|uniref:VWA domain-containing protein n=1 Tax=Paenibacillus agricola TaxID=2716264 RepID=A0ABX0J674_9BACL|nr:vWA domain-containing protein [Paenibacillus agricola]NHN29574.1 VWA domain-containing protein [Paenibacillus agricola]